MLEIRTNVPKNTGIVPLSPHKFMWMDTFITVLRKNESVFPFTAEELAALESQVACFKESIQTSLAAQRAALGAVKHKSTSRQKATESVRLAVRRIHSDPSIADAEKQAAGIRVNVRKHVSTEVQPPLNLVARPTLTGGVDLAWKGSGNRPGTIYIVEAFSSELRTWQFLGISTKQSFRDKTAVPGLHCNYRVMAQRGESQSPYSRPAHAYSE